MECSNLGAIFSPTGERMRIEPRVRFRPPSCNHSSPVSASALPPATRLEARKLWKHHQLPFVI